MLRLRGGSSFKALCTNHLSGETKSIVVYDGPVTTIATLIASAAEEIKVNASQIAILINGKPALDTAEINLEKDEKRNKFTYILKFGYKDIVFTQLATGVWSAKVLELSDIKTLNELLGNNKQLHQHIAAMKLSAEIPASVWYTLVGLKLLK